MATEKDHTGKLSDSIDDDSDIIDELESVSSYEASNKLVLDEFDKIKDNSLDVINDLVELLDLTLVVWLREVHNKYKLPYLMILHYLEISNYVTNMAEELILKKINSE